ncbi:hypothetical protein ACX0KM_06345 [Pseudomonas promysalinigenes]
MLFTFLFGAEIGACYAPASGWQCLGEEVEACGQGHPSILTARLFLLRGSGAERGGENKKRLIAGRQVKHDKMLLSRDVYRFDG